MLHAHEAGSAPLVPLWILEKGTSELCAPICPLSQALYALHKLHHCRTRHLSQARVSEQVPWRIWWITSVLKEGQGLGKKKKGGRTSRKERGNKQHDTRGDLHEFCTIRTQSARCGRMKHKVRGVGSESLCHANSLGFMWRQWASIFRWMFQSGI